MSKEIDLNLELKLPLKKEWWNKISKGEKTHEYREVKPYWTKRIYCGKMQKVHSILFRLGYTNTYMPAKIINITIVNGLNTDLKVDKPVYDIEFSLIKRCKNASQKMD